jgi:large subunit ribosomal protein L22
MNIASEKTMEGISGIAFLRKCVIAPRKMRMVADLIRGKNVVLALNILKCEQKKCSAYFKKLLLSAMANYQRKCEMKKIENLNTKDLVISTLKVDGNGMLKRLLPAPQGRAFRIRRRLSNVSIIVGQRILKNSETEKDFEKLANSANEKKEKGIKKINNKVKKNGK